MKILFVNHNFQVFFFFFSDLSKKKKVKKCGYAEDECRRITLNKIVVYFINQTILPQ